MHMGIYAVALIFFNGLARWLMGERTIPILALVEMALAAAVVAMAESWIFPRYQEWEGRALTRRTALWVLVCNLGFLGGAVVFQWFQGVPLWGMGVPIDRSPRPFGRGLCCHHQIIREQTRLAYSAGSSRGRPARRRAWA